MPPCGEAEVRAAMNGPLLLLRDGIWRAERAANYQYLKNLLFTYHMN